MTNSPYSEYAPDKAERAKALLRHYLVTVAERGKDLKWDSDNDAEIGMLVDYIVEAAIERIYAASGAKSERKK
jgi:hypothetical protein